MINKVLNLVVVCAGDASLHTAYLEPHRNYDLCVVYFGEQLNRYRDQAEHYLAAKGTQTQLLDKLFRQMPGLLDQYEQFWLADDDLETNTTDINRLFDLFRQSGFYIAQPSLTPDSYASFSMLTCKGLGSCETNFIEIMCPLFNQRSLKSSVQYFAESRTGWGVDELWSVRAIELGEKLGIFDQVQVGHYRPIGSSGWYRKLELDPFVESRELKLRHGLADRLPCRFHPLYEIPDPELRTGLPATSPFIIGGQSGCGLRAVTEILLRSRRMYLDLDQHSDYPQVLDSKCMRTNDAGDGQCSGLAVPDLITKVLQLTGSSDYEFSTLPTELQAELLTGGRQMQHAIEVAANDAQGYQHALNSLGEKSHRREQWGWQDPCSLYYLPLWKELFGRFRFIHLVRDPRSIRDRQLESDPQFFAALFAHQAPEVHDDQAHRFELCWARLNLGVYQWASREMPNDYLLLRAEDLAGQDDKARREISRLLNFAGLNFVDRSIVDAVFRPITEVQAAPRTGLVAEALATFRYL